MLAPAHDPLLSTVAAASRLRLRATCTGHVSAEPSPVVIASRRYAAAGCARKLGSSEADVTLNQWLSSSLFKAAYVIIDSLFSASHGLYP